MKCEACDHQNIDGARFCANCGALMPTEKGPDPMVGQLIGGRYRVTGVLGEGGMGIVYVGEQQMGSTVRKVAIKTLHQHLSKDPSVLARFHRECGTVAQLEHPNTIKFYDFGATADGTLYIAMEFVAGKPLSDVIAQGPIASERVVKIMRQVCGALDEAHMQGIIHRDLKPDNLILTQRAGETDFVKVLDFGIAARTESSDAQKEQKLTQQGMVLGTPPYMSPEQFTGKALDARSDIYSLAVMSYEMLTGRLPFDADTPWQWATQHMSAQPIPFEVSAPSKDIPNGMREAILRAMSKDKEQRQSTARDFFAQLSGGDRMTVEAPAGAHAATGTAAMAQVPDFVGSAGGAPVKTQIGAQHVAPAHPAAPPVAIPPARSGAHKKEGGKGLVIGLGVLGGVLLIAMAVLAARSMKQPDDNLPLAINTSTSTNGGKSVGQAPVTKIEELEKPPPSPSPDPTVGVGGVPAGTPTPDPTPKPQPNPGTKPPLTGAKACEACIAAASGGNVASAAANYRRCDDAGKKAQCSSVAKNAAPSAAKSMALNGNCAGAKAIIAGASAMGADSGALSNALNNTSCK
jgi:serine/threonine-protein kinase